MLRINQEQINSLDKVVRASLVDKLAKRYSSRSEKFPEPLRSMIAKHVSIAESLGFSVPVEAERYVDFLFLIRKSFGGVIERPDVPGILCNVELPPKFRLDLVQSLVDGRISSEKDNSPFIL